MTDPEAARASGDHTDGAVPGTVEELIRAFAAEHRCPSLAWGIVRDGTLTTTGSVGTLDDASAPTSRTVYRIASMTKSFTAATVLALRDEGVLRLDDPIGTHAPELARLAGPSSDAAAITLRHLLSMSSGLATDDAWADRHLDLDDDGLDEIVAAGLHLAVATGTRYEYSNLGYALIGRIVERATGTTVQRHVRERFLEPLGMSRTTWTQPAHDDWARPYRKWDDGHASEVLVGDGVLAPMGGLWSCVDDLATWATWFEDAFPPRDDADTAPLRRSSRREMQQIHRYNAEDELAGRKSPAGYGFGLSMRDDSQLGLLVGHSGGLPGYGSNMRWALGRRIGVIALANVTYARMAELTLRIMDAMHAAGDLPVAVVPVDRAIDEAARRLVALLNDWDDGAADALFTDNVGLDNPYERRRRQVHHVVGEAFPIALSSITALSAAAADLHVVDAEGTALTIEMELAPLRPVRVESFAIRR